jgi:hypothetical protein
VPELRIVDQELWDRVKARQQGLRRNQAFHETSYPRGSGLPCWLVEVDWRR